MKLIEVPDNNNYWNRLETEDGKIEMGIYPVMFGWRVRAGCVGEEYYKVDYCTGANNTFLCVVYSLMKSAIEKEIPFKDFPEQYVKPFHNDPVHFAEFVSLAGEFNRIYIDQRKLDQKKIELLTGILKPK